MPRASLDELEDAFEEAGGAVDMGDLESDDDDENLLMEDDDENLLMEDDEEDLDVDLLTVTYVADECDCCAGDAE